MKYGNRPQYSNQPKSWYQRWWGILILIFITIVLIVASAFFFSVLDYFFKYKSGEINYQNLNQQKQQAQEDFLDSAQAPYLGNPDANIIIVEFADFKCPYCQQSVPVIKSLIQQYPKEIKIVFRNLPIFSEESLQAANAAACAQEQSNLAFWAMHDELFNNQDNLNKEKFQKIAENLGFEINRFNNCLNSNKYYGKIQKDMEEAQKAGANQTPTFFINGHKVEGHQSLQNWQAVLDQTIKMINSQK